MKPFKTIITAILLCAIIAPVAVQVAGFIKLSRLHNNFEHRLRHEQQHTITLPENTIVWAKPDKEIWYQGRMFDIKQSSRSNGMVTFKGLFDDEEKALKQQLAKETRKAAENAAQNLTHMFLTGLYVQPVENLYCRPPGLLPETKTTTGYLASLYTSVYSGAPAPPPWPVAC